MELVVFIIMFLLALADKNYESICNDWCADFFWFLVPVVFIFPFSVVTYFLKDQIFHSWIKFTYYWIPISMFLVLIIPGGGGRGSFPSLIDAESISIIMSGLYLIISLIIVIIGSIKNYYFNK